MGFFKSLFKSFGSMIGIGGGSDELAKKKQAELDLLRQQQQLQSANEQQNVAQFDSNQNTFQDAGTAVARRKKTQVGAGSAAMALGLSGGS